MQHHLPRQELLKSQAVMIKTPVDTFWARTIKKRREGLVPRGVPLWLQGETRKGPREPIKTSLVTHIEEADGGIWNWTELAVNSPLSRSLFAGS